MLLSHGVRVRPMPVRPGSLTRREHQIGGDLSCVIFALRAGSILASRSLRSHLISDVDRPQERLIVICKDECASRVAITRGLVVQS